MKSFPSCAGLTRASTTFLSCSVKDVDGRDKPGHDDLGRSQRTTVGMKRREFITLFGGAAAWPLAARAQQPVMPVIGLLQAGSAEPNAKRTAYFREGLSKTGYVDGQNVQIDARWAEGRNDRLPDLAADLARRRVAVIVTPLSTAATLAAKAATATIPIVFAVGGDPLKLGLVASLNQPGGNATGMSVLNVELTAKRFGLVHELVPQATHYFALVNPNSALTEPIIKALQADIPGIGRSVEIVRAGSDREIDAAFAEISQKTGGVLMVSPDELFFDRLAQIVALAAHHRLPTIYPYSDSTEAGGLMSYGTDERNVFQEVGIYVGRILKGEKPADLPVVQPTKFELIINLKTAKVLGLTVPPTLLALADEVIE
jgi:putative ABC transport system substrate-binding protein